MSFERERSNYEKWFADRCVILGQHPRDLFDVRTLLDRGPLDPATVDCFVAYLVGHNRPIHEVLFPRARDLSSDYERDFVGMTREIVALETLVATQAKLLESLPRALTPAHREFLRSVVRLEPAWDLMPFGHLQELPAVRWKLDNLRKLQRRSSDEFAAQSRDLDERLAGL